MLADPLGQRLVDLPGIEDAPDLLTGLFIGFGDRRIGTVDQQGVIKPAGAGIEVKIALTRRFDLFVQVENPLTRLLNRELRRSDVWVDPRFGRAVETGGTVVIQPPAAPQVREKPPAPTVGLPTPTP